MLNEKMYQFWLSNIEGIGPRKYKALIEHRSAASNVFQCGREDLLGIPSISAKDVNRIVALRNEDIIMRKYNELSKKGVRFVSQDDENYPSLLLQMYDPPIGLYVKGRMPEVDQKCIAIVGARECSQYGRDMAKLYGQTFSRAGVAVISGMAMGVDGCAHRGALSGSGGTFAVVGCGVDVCYPRSNYRLYNEIAENGGIISEYPPGTRVSPGHFPMRNRIIMGMSLAVVVVEARNKSGSLITAQLAADAGREVFVVPGHITDSLFEGGRQLALSGAQMTAGPESIMDYFDILEPKFNISLENLNNLLETTDKIVYANLRCEPKHIDEIIQSSGLPATQVMKSLISLECRNLCKQVVQNYYVKIVV